ncbi:MAG: DNA/RNA nuclease SfsA [Lentisphaeria bacterium]|nr:DNA/RNA nuclease SfsA [Lentisphaeria bacterium]
MKYQQTLLFGTLIKRYKRFLADIRLDDGSLVTAHCPNSGSMRMCAEPGWRAALSRGDNPGRKLPYTWELVNNGNCWICVNTQIPNIVAAEAIAAGMIPELAGYKNPRREVRYGENSRIDILLENEREKCFVEVKNVTLLDDDKAYCFPDAVTARGLKHLRELSREVEAGNRAVMLYIINRSDGNGFRPAHDIDPAYARGLRAAAAAGVEILAYQTRITPEEISVDAAVDILPSTFGE